MSFRMPAGLCCYGCCRVQGVRGDRRSNDRLVNGIVWKLQTGLVWCDVPERHGSWQALDTRFRGWALDGMFLRLLRAVQAHDDAAAHIDWPVSVDSSIRRAHHRAAGGTTRRLTAMKRVFTCLADPVVDGARKSPWPARGAVGFSTSRLNQVLNLTNKDDF
ncbi:transposase [Streptomyces asoensis]|uniref:transposase n=1 Tax=Streptomyces asoensis TaxID=249586 RepID=UPI0033CFE094